jgi:hypothetical protein
MIESKILLESGVRALGQLNEWYATHRPQDLIDDIQTGHVVFLETELVIIFVKRLLWLEGLLAKRSLGLFVDQCARTSY